MPNVSFGPYSTITVAAASGVYRLKSSSGSAKSIDIMNTGAGTIFLRADVDPTTSDVNSLSIPSNWAVNSLNVDANLGLGIIAAADTTISVRAR